MQTSRLYHQLQSLLGQSVPWADQRHLQTLIWMVIGLVLSECISLTKWRVYISVQYRGRAVPLVWRAMRHDSSTVRFEVYQAMLKRATRLVSPDVEVCFLADRPKTP